MKQLAVLPIALALAACGGGSDGDSSGSPAGGYTVYESSSSNNTIGTAEAARVGTTIVGSVSASDEYDVFSINVRSGESIRIDLAAANSSDLDLHLVNSSVVELDSSIGDYSRETVSYTSNGNQTLYVVVEWFDGPQTTYDLTITSNMPADTNAGSGGNGGSAGAASFCVESISADSSYYQIVSGTTGATNNMIAGTCPSTGWASRCGWDLGSIQTNSYFSQGYVDTVGGHSQVRSGVCDVQAQNGGSTIYTIY